MAKNTNLPVTPIGIVGMGVTGHAILDLLMQLGVNRNSIFTFDKKEKADFDQYVDFFNTIGSGSLVVSPGIPLKTEPLIRHASNITSELAIAFNFLTTEKVIAVTGSVGKSTTSALIHEAAKIVDENAFLGGNFGTPLAKYVSDVLSGKVKKAKYITLELSSYQLENFKNLQCAVSAITYLSSNHLERYSSVEEYYQTKLSILDKTSEKVFLNSGSPDLMQIASMIKNKKIDICSPECISTKLIGSHNLQNLSIALNIGRYFNWPQQALDAMCNFEGLPHRIENVGRRSGIHFINDSKSTTIDSSLSAIQTCLETVSKDCYLHVLLGGKDKNLPWQELRSLKNIDNCKFYFFGQSAQLAKRASQLGGDEFKNLKSAIIAIHSNAKAKDSVLLSPGGASQDEFKNFEERGDYFKNLVAQLWPVESQ